MEVDKIGVHVTHCCKRCGCKYGDDDCPVELGKVEAEFECEFCESRLNSLVDELENASLEELEKVFYALTLRPQLFIREILSNDYDL